MSSLLRLTNKLAVPAEEVEIKAIRAQGHGGQHVNKASTAVHLRFDIHRSSLPEQCKERLLKFADQRISDDGVIVIKAQNYRSQEKNRQEALQRLQELVGRATAIPKRRVATRPTRSSQVRRVDSKTRRGKTKSLRGKVID